METTSFTAVQTFTGSCRRSIGLEGQLALENAANEDPYLLAVTYNELASKLALNHLQATKEVPFDLKSVTVYGPFCEVDTEINCAREARVSLEFCGYWLPRWKTFWRQNNTIVCQESAQSPLALLNSDPEQAPTHAACPQQLELVNRILGLRVAMLLDDKIIPCPTMPS